MNTSVRVPLVENSFFELVDRVTENFKISELSKNIPQTGNVVHTPSSTFDAINKPLSFTPYFEIGNILEALSKHSNAIGGGEESTDIIEYPSNNTTH